MKFINNICEKDRTLILKPNIRNGYYVICLRKNNKRKNYQIHRLVAEAFINNPNNYQIVNHLDFNKLNNKVDNLEWCTQKQNVLWSINRMRGKRKILKGKELYGITYRNRGTGYYEITLNKNYCGRANTLIEAQKIRDLKIKELGIAI